jgi:hypothetical protein
VDESHNQHLDAATHRWQQEETTARRWSLMLRMLPTAVVGTLLVVVFRVFG